MKNLILALENSTNICSISIRYKKYYIEINNLKNIEKNNNEKILQNIDWLTFISKIKINDVKIISYNFGPGSFTGLRISSAICQGLFFNKEKKIIRISSLQIISQQIWEKYKKKKILVAIQSKFNEIYICAYKFNLKKK